MMKLNFKVSLGHSLNIIPNASNEIKSGIIIRNLELLTHFQHRPKYHEDWNKDEFLMEFSHCVKGRQDICEGFYLINYPTVNCVALTNTLLATDFSSWIEDNANAFASIKNNHELSNRIVKLNAGIVRLKRALRTQEIKRRSKAVTNDTTTSAKGPSPFYITIANYPDNFILDSPWNARLEYWKDRIRELDVEDSIDIEEIRVRDDTLIEFYTYSQLNEVEITKLESKLTANGIFEWITADQLGNVIVENKRKKIKADMSSYRYVMFINKDSPIRLNTQDVDKIATDIHTYINNSRKACGFGPLNYSADDFKSSINVCFHSQSIGIYLVLILNQANTMVTSTKFDTLTITFAIDRYDAYRCALGAKLRLPWKDDETKEVIVEVNNIPKNNLILRSESSQPFLVSFLPSNSRISSPNRVMIILLEAGYSPDYIERYDYKTFIYINMAVPKNKNIPIRYTHRAIASNYFSVVAITDTEMDPVKLSLLKHNNK